MGSFTPLVFSTFGGMGGAATTVYKRLASRLLSAKRDQSYGLVRGVGNDWNFVSHLWNYFWKMKYGLKMLLFHSYFERWKLDINKCNDRLRKCSDTLRKFTETSLIFKITVIIYEILRTESWNMSHEIFQKVEIWALIFLSLKFLRWFLIVTYPSVWWCLGYVAQ